MNQFIEEEYSKVNYAELSPADQQAHTQSIVNVVMGTIVNAHIKHFMNIGSKIALAEKEAIAEPVIKKKTKPINPLRHNADGTYNSHVLDPDYAHKYYNENLKGITVTCPCCGSELLKTNLAKHRKSLKCRHVAMSQAHNAKPS